MATNLEKIALAMEMLEGAEASVRSAKQLLIEVMGKRANIRKARIAQNLTGLNGPQVSGNEKIVEGVFDGEKMTGSDKNEYAVPANYASKSKLVPGDVLKLTIKEDGSFMYKQISPIERKHILGTLTYDNGRYKVLAGGKLYNILLASVTYYKGEVGDKVSLIVPASQDSDWGAVDAIIPQAESQAVGAASDAAGAEAPAPAAETAQEAPAEEAAAAQEAPAEEKPAPKAKKATKVEDTNEDA